MFITPEEAQRRLNSPNNLKNIIPSSVSNHSAHADAPRAEVFREKNLPQPDSSPSFSSDASDLGPSSHNPSPQNSEPDIKLKTPVDIDNRMKIIAQALIKQGVSEREVSRHLNITVQTLRSISEQDSKKVSSSIEKIRELAIDRLMIALGLMTQDKFENASLKELTNACGQLSKVISQTDPNLVQGEHNNVQFIIHAPIARSIKDYQIIDV